MNTEIALNSQNILVLYTDDIAYPNIQFKQIISEDYYFLCKQSFNSKVALITNNNEDYCVIAAMILDINRGIIFHPESIAKINHISLLDASKGISEASIQYINQQVTIPECDIGSLRASLSSLLENYIHYIKHYQLGYNLENIEQWRTESSNNTTSYFNKILYEISDKLFSKSIELEFELKRYIFRPEGELYLKISKLDSFIKNALENKERSVTEKQKNNIGHPTEQDIKPNSFAYMGRITYAIGFIAVIFFFFIQPLYVKYISNNTHEEQFTKTKQDLDNLKNELLKAQEENHSLQKKFAEKEAEINTKLGSSVNPIPIIRPFELKSISDQDIANAKQKHKVTLKLKKTSDNIDLSGIKIQITNIHQKYTDGIELTNGMYKVQLTKGNDTTKPLKQYIFIIDENNTQPEIILDLPL